MVCGMSVEIDLATICEAKRHFAGCARLHAEQQEREEHEWLTFWSGQQWGDEAPNRLFGAWLNQDGEAV